MKENKYDLSTKARTLVELRAKLNQFKIPEFIYFTCEEYESNRDNIIERIHCYFADKSSRVAVRSSASDEDGVVHSLAGEYESVLDVDINNLDTLKDAIDVVIQSYHRRSDPEEGGRDEVLVQTMLTDTIMSGVVFTHDLNVGAPYYVINYDDRSGLTNTVTAGEGKYSNRTLYIYRTASDEIRSVRFRRIIGALKELEEKIGNHFLDVEFAMDGDLVPYLLQVRSITTKSRWNVSIEEDIDSALNGVKRFIGTKFRPNFGVYGVTTVFGQMPDWNPAEMIGRVPRGLALSLYRSLITDNAWRIARKKMGYAVPSNQPLMVSLAGQPFIDVRLSFHSYLPEGITHDIGTKLVDFWINELIEHPEYHDKVEFKIAITSFCLNIDKKIERLGNVLSRNEKALFKRLIGKQFNELLDPSYSGSLDKALERIHALKAKQDIWQSTSGREDLYLIFEMIEECINNGTVPFAILARHGFIAKALLDSLLELQILSEEDIRAFQESTKTVAGDMVADLRELRNGDLSMEDFMEIYGHLRPGTYDVLSARYDHLGKGFEPHFNAETLVDKRKFTFVLTEKARQKINRILKDEKISSANADTLMEYIRSATSAREYGKFVFTKTVSDILELVTSFAEENGATREQVSYVPIDVFLGLASASVEGDIGEIIQASSSKEKKRHTMSSSIRLPQILFDETGVHIIPFQVSHPNFITKKNVVGDTIILSGDRSSSNLQDKIVLIENADPGFDWIFGQNIKGLITKYGGVNSHMAIRCAEFGIPAAIGCGEQQYEKLLELNQITLNCSDAVIQSV